MLKGQEWARCWFVDHPGDAQLIDLVCQKHVDPSYPYGLGDVYVSPQSSPASATS